MLVGVVLGSARAPRCPPHLRAHGAVCWALRGSCCLRDVGVCQQVVLWNTLRAPRHRWYSAPQLVLGSAEGAPQRGAACSAVWGRVGACAGQLNMLVIETGRSR